jgi:hypothetical protein
MSEKEIGNVGAKKKERAHFTIDGRPFELDEPKQLVEDLLRLAGLDPAAYDLAEVRPGNPEPRRLKDEKRITVKDGDRFVSIRERAEVA